MLEQKSKSRARVKVAFFCVVGVHVAAILVALLAQGCKREAPPQTESGQPPVADNTNQVPALDVTNTAYANVPTNAVAPPPPEPPPVSTAQEYVIQKGDILGTIATKFHVTVKALQAANPTVDPTKLKIGSKLTIPAPPAPAPAGGTGVLAPETASDVYVVKSGDTLDKISREHHTTVSALKKLNNLATDKIKVGQKLNLPPSAAPVAPAPVDSAPAPTAVPPPPR